MLTDYWKQFDLILCINLKERTDRRISSEAMFQKLGITNVEYMTVDRSPKGGEVGCFESHQACIRKAYEFGADNVLIFEDDPDVLNMPTQHILTEIIRFMRTNQDWDLLFLGAYPNIFFGTSKAVPNFSNIFKVSSQLTHAVCVSRRMMAKMTRLNHATFNVPIDALYSINNNSYCVFPCLFFQTDSPSDISSAPRGNLKLRKAVVQFKNTFSQNSPVPLYYLIIALVVLLLFFLLVALVRKRK